MLDRQAEYILAIAEEGSISKAAKRLYISQPSMSQMLKKAEAAYGVTFFERTSGSALVLTYAGEKYVAAMREMMQIQQKLSRQFQEITESKMGRMSLGIATGYGVHMLPMILPKFREQFPQVELEIIRAPSQKLEEMLLSRALDIAVFFHHKKNQQFCYLPLPAEELMIVLPPGHPLSKDYRNRQGSAERPMLSLKNILYEPFITLTVGLWIRIWTDRLFNSLNVYPDTILEVSDNALAYALVESGMGNTVLPDNFIRFGTTRQDCPCFSIAETRTFRQVSVCYRHDAFLTRYMDAMLQLIRERSAEVGKSTADD